MYKFLDLVYSETKGEKWMSAKIQRQNPATKRTDCYQSLESQKCYTGKGLSLKQNDSNIFWRTKHT